MRKILVVRFSSFGDILQCFPVAEHYNNLGKEVHWLTRSDYEELVRTNPAVTKTIGFSRKSGLLGLLRLAFSLRKEGYEIVYDAHNNLRSNLLCLVLRWGSKFIKRPKHRIKRFVLFYFRRNLFKSWIGRKTYLEPLGVDQQSFQWNLNFLKQNYVTLVPGAAWPLKVWPLEYWRQLIKAFPQEKFVVLGGERDEICFQLKGAGPNVTVLAGQLSLLESIRWLSGSKAVVANDTGLLHGADLLKIPLIALIGPSAFGYPMEETSKVAEVKLWCKPCSKDGRGRCVNSEYQKCMKDIEPDRVVQMLKVILSE